MTEVLLSSEKMVKSIVAIEDNVAGEHVRAALLEAQKIDLVQVIGQELLEKLQDLVKEHAMDNPENKTYKRLMDKIQYYLAYGVMTRLTYNTTYKVTNFGVVKCVDENMATPKYNEVSLIRDYWQSKVDAMCNQMQLFILENVDGLPEVKERDINKINACLYSAASCGIFLGGARGKEIHGI